LNNQFKELWKGKYSFSKDSDMDLFSVSKVLNRFNVDNKGRVFTIMNQPIDKSLKVKDGPKVNCNFFIFENGAKAPKKIDINFDKRMICNYNILQSTNSDEIVAVGSYSESKYEEWFSSTVGVTGSFFLKINTQSGSIVTKSINPFTRKMFDFMKINEKEEKNGDGIKNLDITSTRKTDKDNFTISFEHNYNISREGLKNTFFYSGVIFTLKYDKEGKIIYQKDLPKAAFANNCTFGLGHILTPKGEGHSVIYNDSKKNTEKKLEDYKDLSQANPGSDKCIVRLVSIDENGIKKISTLFDNKEDDFALIPNSSFQYAPGVIVSLAVDGKKYKLVKIEN
jgi:hypothetical protein